MPATVQPARRGPCRRSCGAGAGGCPGGEGAVGGARRLSRLTDSKATRGAPERGDLPQRRPQATGQVQPGRTDVGGLGRAAFSHLRACERAPDSPQAALFLHSGRFDPSAGATTRQRAGVQICDVLRDARRRRGLSVRAAAQRCDVPRGTWAGWESGQTSPTTQRLDEVLRTLHLDLLLVEKAAEPPGGAAVRRYLRQSLTSRATLGLGEQWSAAVRACQDRPRLLTGPAAVGGPPGPAPAARLSTPQLISVCDLSRAALSTDQDSCRGPGHRTLRPGRRPPRRPTDGTRAWSVARTASPPAATASCSSGSTTRRPRATTGCSPPHRRSHRSSTSRPATATPPATGCSCTASPSRTPPDALPRLTAADHDADSTTSLAAELTTTPSVPASTPVSCRP